MLWISGRITAFGIIQQTFLASLANWLVPLAGFIILATRRKAAKNSTFAEGSGPKLADFSSSPAYPRFVTESARTCV